MTWTPCPPLAEPTPRLEITPHVLRQMRRDAGIEQQWLAAQLGVSAAALSLYERHGKCLSEAKALRAADILEAR